MSPIANADEMVSDLGASYHVKDGAWLFDESIASDYVVRHLEDKDLHAWTREMISKYGGKTILYIPLYVQGRLLGHAELWDSRSIVNSHAMKFHFVVPFLNRQQSPLQMPIFLNNFKRS
jgi:hypothetical protein